VAHFLRQPNQLNTALMAGMDVLEADKDVADLR
jgi:hypothetical protein